MSTTKYSVARQIIFGLNFDCTPEIINSSNLQNRVHRNALASKPMQKYVFPIADIRSFVGIHRLRYEFLTSSRGFPYLISIFMNLRVSKVKLISYYIDSNHSMISAHKKMNVFHFIMLRNRYSVLHNVRVLEYAYSISCDVQANIGV